MVCARLNFFKNFIFIFSPRRSRRGTLGISSPGGPVEEPLKPFCSFFSLCRLSSSVVFQWGSLRQTLDLSKTTNEKVPWRRPSNKGSKVQARHGHAGEWLWVPEKNHWLIISFLLKSTHVGEKMVKQGNWDIDRLEVRWEAVMFLFNVVNLNV